MSFNLNDFIIALGNVVAHVKSSGVLDQIIHGEGGLGKDIAIAEAGMTAISELAPVFATQTPAPGADPSAAAATAGATDNTANSAK